MTIPRGSVEFFDGAKMPHNSEFLLLASDEEGGLLQIIDDAQDFAEAKRKVAIFLEDHPNGGVIITKYMCAAYRLPIFDNKEAN